MTEDIPEILKDYTFIKDIGEGNFGKVKLSTLKSTNEQFAIKILNKAKLKSQTKSSSFNEIEILSILKHPNIIHVENILEDNQNYYIIMEYCQNGELFEYIVKKEKLDEEESSIFFYQLINGVDYIHKKGFAHRDLKPENLLLTQNKKLKIIDFGLCHDFNGTKLLITKCGSPSYAAPEILKGFPYNGFKTDIWCCGIILYGMSCGYLPFDGDDNQEIFREIVECKPEYPSFLEDDCINLLKGLLNPNPKKRISLSQIKKHPFYLKGKYNYLNKYNDEVEEIEEELDSNENNVEKNNSVDKKNYAFTSIRKNQEEAFSYDKNRTLKMKKDKKFKNNIYQNIFINIVNNKDDNENDGEKDDINIQINDKENENELNYKENEKYDKAEKRKINEIADLTNNIKNLNEEKPLSLFLRTFGNKFQNNKLKLEPNKFQYNNNDDSFTKNKDNKNKRGFSLNVNILNENSCDKDRTNRLFIKKYNKNNNAINENVKNALNKKRNFKNLKLKTEKLDFLQKFLINSKKNKKNNQIENFEKSPLKTKGINFNLILTKQKEKNENENENLINANKNNENIKDKQLTIKKNRVKTANKMIFTEKRKKSEFAQTKIVLHSEINLASSPNSINKNQRRYNFDKFFGSVYGNKNNEQDLRTFTVKKRNNKNLKINKKFNLKIINLTSKGNTIKKEKRSKFVKSYPNNKKQKENIKEIIMNKRELNVNEVFKTEPKANHFLDNVIKKMNTNKNKKTTINNIKTITFNSRFKHEENKQVIRMLNLDKNNKEKRCPYLINYYKNSSNDERINKNSPIHLNKEDKKHFLSIKTKNLDNNLNPMHNIKRIFPNILISNKNI